MVYQLYVYICEDAKRATGGSVCDLVKNQMMRELDNQGLPFTDMYILR